jgi:hypothetical protein
MKKSLIFLLTVYSVFTFIATGCQAGTARRNKFRDLSLYVEYLVRGDTDSASQLLKKEDTASFKDLYILFLPKLRSMEDTELRFPVFIESRSKRFGTVREYKRAGLLGEGRDGLIKIIETNPAAKEKAVRETLKPLVLKENFDRDCIISFMLQNSSKGRKDIVKGFVQARRKLALTGDMIEAVNKEGESTWVEARRE